MLPAASNESAVAGLPINAAPASAISNGIGATADSAIFAAAMSTIAAEMASLSTATVIDFYRRFARRQAEDRHYLRVSRLATGFW
ncbi:MAG: hypothetical protein QF773_11725, partial [Lentisphaeria bacterium]|nr:hypothetical protein [Lentisphaeria bacterium]